MLLAPSLSGVDQVGRSGGLIQTRRLTCEVASLDRAGGSAAPYLSLESAEEALPGPLLPARPGRSRRAAQTAQQTQHLRLYSSLYCLMGRAAKQSFVFSAPEPGSSAWRRASDAGWGARQPRRPLGVLGPPRARVAATRPRIAQGRGQPEPPRAARIWV